MAEANMPVGGPTIREAVGVFDDPEKLQAAVSELEGSGFDRADISLLAREGVGGHLPSDLQNKRDIRSAADDPAAAREGMIDDSDLRQGRVLATSLGATVAAMAAAGITVMTGGALAVAVGAAAVVAGGVGGISALLGQKAGESEKTHLQEQLDRGGVLLWVRTKDAAAEQRAAGILRRHSAHDVRVHDISA